MFVQFFDIAHEANPFALFTLVYVDSFEAALQALDQIDLPAAGSLEDALQFFDADAGLWRDTDGALDWARETATRLKLSPPARADALTTSGGDSADTHAMFVGMYFTALDMAQEGK